MRVIGAALDEANVGGEVAAFVGEPVGDAFAHGERWGEFCELDEVGGVVGCLEVLVVVVVVVSVEGFGGKAHLRKGMEVMVGDFAD